MNTKACNRCGQPVNIVPAGVSKRTGKPYGSFTKCAACGFSEQIGIQPPRQPGARQMGNTERIISLLEHIADRVDTMHDAILSEIKAEPPQEPTQNPPF